MTIHNMRYWLRNHPKGPLKRKDNTMKKTSNTLTRIGTAATAAAVLFAGTPRASASHASDIALGIVGLVAATAVVSAMTPPPPQPVVVQPQPVIHTAPAPVIVHDHHVVCAPPPPHHHHHAAPPPPHHHHAAPPAPHGRPGRRR